MYQHPNVFRKILELSLNMKIIKFRYLNPELPIRQFIEKGKRLDVYLETYDSYVDIEISKNYRTYIKNRNLAYGFKMYCETVERGDNYDLYKKIQLINFIFNKNHKKGIVNSYLTDQFGNITSEMLLYSEIYIEYFINMYYNKNIEEIHKYKYFIMLGLTLKQLNKFYEEYGDDIVKEYKDALEEISSNEEFKPLFTKEEDERRIRNSERIYGEIKGERKKQIEIAKNLLKNGIDVNIISESTGLSVEEILKFS